nr:CesT family type III secretion system chaperone [uncultured Pseudomonas sp.]
MNAREMTRQLLREYSHQTNKPHIELNELGAAVVAVDPDVKITLYLGEQADSLLFLADILSLTPSPRDDLLLRALLTHAFPGYRTRGGALLINEASNNLVFSYEKKLAELAPVTLENLIGNLSETVLYFRRKAAELRMA